MTGDPNIPTDISRALIGQMYQSNVELARTVEKLSGAMESIARTQSEHSRILESHVAALRGSADNTSPGLGETVRTLGNRMSDLDNKVSGIPAMQVAVDKLSHDKSRTNKWADLVIQIVITALVSSFMVWLIGQVTV